MNARNAGAGGKIMKTQDKLLILLDGSERALDAVRYVASVKSFNAMSVVVLFNVYAHLPQSYLDLERTPESAEEKAHISSWLSGQQNRRVKYMEKAEKILKEGGIAEVKIRIQQLTLGVARDILVEARQEYAAVVMTRRGMGLLAGLPVGSVANKLLQKMSFAPIILAAQKASSDRVLIAVDGSSDARRAVTFAGEMLGRGHQIGLIHVIRNLPGTDFMMTSTDIRQAKAQMEDAFLKIKARLEQSGSRPEDISLKIIDDSGSRAGAILQEAVEGSYDTIILGRKGLSKVSDFSMGRVSTKIVQMADRHAVWLV